MSNWGANRAYYFWDEHRGELRHGHEFPDKPGGRGDHWHRAAQVHSDYPYLHNSIRAYDRGYVDWSQKNWLNSRKEVEKLTDALRNHNHSGGRYYRGWDEEVSDRYWCDYNTFENTTPTKPRPEPIEAAYTVQPTPQLPAPPAEPTSEDEILELLTALPGRVDALEGAQAAMMQQDFELRTTVNNLRGEVAEAKANDFRLGERLSQAEASQTGFATNLVGLGERVTKLEESQARRVVFEVREPDKEPRTLPERVYHEKFDLLRRLCLPGRLNAGRRNIWLAGPAGSGKTTAAEQLAELLGLECESHGALTSPYDVLGHFDIKGEYRSTALRRRFEFGGVLLLDEIDACDQRALVILNQALSNGQTTFPDRTVPRHPDCIVIASANTWGFGGDGNYMARMKQDAAALDRFVTISWHYDPVFEASLATHDEWCKIVQQVRAAANKQEAQIVISPRATLNGCDLLTSGDFTNEEVVEVVFGRYRDIPDWDVIGRAAEEFAKRKQAPQAPPEAVKVEQPSSNGVAHATLPKIDFSHARVYGNAR